MTIKADKGDVLPYVLWDGVAFVHRTDRGSVWKTILTPLGRIANTIHLEDQYD